MASNLVSASSHVGAIVAFGVEAGLDRDAILAAAGLPPGHLFDPDGHRPFRSACRAWEFIVRELRDPATPLRLAVTMGADAYRVLGIAVYTSMNVREAISRAVRHAKLVTNSGEFQLLEAPTFATLTWTRDLPPTLAIRTANESAIAQFLHFCRLVTASDVRPLEVTFRHPAPAPMEAHEVFFGCRVSFDGEHDSLSFDPTFLDRTLAGADDAPANFYDGNARSRSAAPLRPATLVEKAREAILANIVTGVPSSAAIARGLGMTDQGLRRRLMREGVTYHALVQSVRLKAAQALLRDSPSSIAEVAFLLGYSHAGAFSRAFRRGVGCSPRVYRQRETAET